MLAPGSPTKATAENKPVNGEKEGPAGLHRAARLCAPKLSIAPVPKPAWKPSLTQPKSTWPTTPACAAPHPLPELTSTADAVLTSTSAPTLNCPPNSTLYQFHSKSGCFSIPKTSPIFTTQPQTRCIPNPNSDHTQALNSNVSPPLPTPPQHSKSPAFLKGSSLNLIPNPHPGAPHTLPLSSLPALPYTPHATSSPPSPSSTPNAPSVSTVWQRGTRWIGLCLGAWTGCGPREVGQTPTCLGYESPQRGRG